MERLIEAFKPQIMAAVKKAEAVSQGLTPESPNGAYGVERQDLVQEATIALLNAAYSFDPSKGNRFTTHLKWEIRTAFSKVRDDNLKHSHQKNSETDGEDGSKKCRYSRRVESLDQIEEKAWAGSWGRFNELQNVIGDRSELLKITEVSAREILKLMEIDIPYEANPYYTIMTSRAEARRRRRIADTLPQETYDYILNKLSGKDRKIAKGLWIDGKRSSEIAMQINISPSAVSQRKKKLMEKIEKNFGKTKFS